MNTGEINLMKYEHPKIEKKRIVFSASKEHDIYIEGYNYYDLMTICSLDGELKYNIYGPNWNTNDKNRKDRIEYYRGFSFCRDKIIALYSGNNSFVEVNGSMKSSYPTKFFVFDINGEYIKTLETDYQIRSFTYDEENNRLLIFMDDEIQLGYLDLSGLI